jgi:hypothetical protein
VVANMYLLLKITVFRVSCYVKLIKQETKKLGKNIFNRYSEFVHLIHFKTD